MMRCHPPHPPFGHLLLQGGEGMCLGQGLLHFATKLLHGNLENAASTSIETADAAVVLI